MNLKRLSSHAGEAASGAAAAPQTGHTVTLESDTSASTAARRVNWRSITAAHTPGRPPRRLALPIWTIGLSLN